MIVFLFHKPNDLDHIVPIVYRVAKDRADELLLVSLNPSFPLLQDYRLQFLREQYGIETDYVYRLHTPTPFHQIAALLLCGAPERGLDESRIRYLLRRVYRKFFHRWAFDRIIKRFIFDSRWAEGLLSIVNADVLVFDQSKPHQWVAGALFDAAGAMRVPFMSVPVNLHWFAGNFFADVLAMRRAPGARYEDLASTFGVYDHFIVPHVRMKQVIVENGTPERKIHVLGSPRYCMEWQEVHETFLPGVERFPELHGGRDQLRVLFIDTAHAWIDYEAVAESVRRMARLDFVHLVLKPGPRSNAASKVPVGSGVTAVPAIPTPTLCQWADVIVGTSSSVLVEALQRHKALVYLKFANKQKMIFQEMKACWAVNSYEELEEALRLLARNPSYRPYADDDVDRLLTEVVYGGVAGRDVLREYVDFISNAKRSSSLSVLSEASGGLS